MLVESILLKMKAIIVSIILNCEKNKEMKFAPNSSVDEALNTVDNWTVGEVVELLSPKKNLIEETLIEMELRLLNTKQIDNMYLGSTKHKISHYRKYKENKNDETLKDAEKIHEVITDCRTIQYPVKKGYMYSTYVDDPILGKSEVDASIVFETKEDCVKQALDRLNGGYSEKVEDVVLDEEDQTKLESIIANNETIIGDVDDESWKEVYEVKYIECGDHKFIRENIQ